MSRPQFPVRDTTGRPDLEQADSQVMRVTVEPQAVQTPLRRGTKPIGAVQPDLRSLGGYVLVARFTDESVHTFAVKCSEVPQYIEPMDVIEHAEHPEIEDYHPCSVHVIAVNRSAWTKGSIQLKALSDNLWDTPFPFEQRFRVYAGSGVASSLPPDTGAGTATFGGRLGDLLDDVSTEPKPNGIPRADADGKIDSEWLEHGPNVLELADDFAGGIEDREATVAVDGWAGSAREQPAEVNHPGIVRLAANNSLAVLRAGRAYSTDVVLYAAYVRPASGTATMGLRVGLLAHPSMSDEDSAGIYFSFSPGTSANWRCITRTGGSTTATTTDVAYAVGTWYWLEVVKSDSSYLFYIDGVLKATHTTDIPAFSITRALVVEAAEAADKSVDIDYSDLKTAETGRGV